MERAKKRGWDDSFARSPVPKKKHRAKLIRHLNQEFDPTFDIDFKNFSFRHFHDRINQADNNLGYARERMMKCDDVVKAHGLKAEGLKKHGLKYDTFDMRAEHKKLEDLEKR